MWASAHDSTSAHTTTRHANTSTTTRGYVSRIEHFWPRHPHAPHHLHPSPSPERRAYSPRVYSYTRSITIRLILSGLCATTASITPSA